MHRPAVYSAEIIPEDLQTKIYRWDKLSLLPVAGPLQLLAVSLVPGFMWTWVLLATPPSILVAAQIASLTSLSRAKLCEQTPSLHQYIPMCKLARPVASIPRVLIG
jgi:hypothetical protein